MILDLGTECKTLTMLQRFKFNLEVQFITDALTKRFKHITVSNTKLVRIIVEAHTSQKENIIPPIKGIQPVCVVYVKYDLNNTYFGKSDKDKIETVISIIKKGLFIIIQKLNWDLDSFFDAFNELKDYQSLFEFSLGKCIGNKYNQFYSYVKYELYPSYRIFYLVLKNNKSDIIETVELLRLNNYYMNFYTDYTKIITNGKWIDADTYKIVGKKGKYDRIIILYHLTSKSISIKFNLEEDVDKTWFTKEFELATTLDNNIINDYIESRKNINWHVYLN